MKSLRLRMFVTLITVGIFSGGALGTMYCFTKTPIEKNQEKELREAIFQVLPQAKNYAELTRLDDAIIYKGLDAQGALAGYAVAGKGKGFQGEIKLMVGVEKNLKGFTGLEILESSETPGLGAKIAEEPFKSQFKILKLVQGTNIGYVKNKKPEKETDLQAITGATISSEAIVNIVNELIHKLRNFLKQDNSASAELCNAFANRKSD